MGKIDSDKGKGPYPTHFCNVDLDIFSRARLEPLVAAFGDSVFVHYVGPERGMFGAHVALPSYGQSADTLTRDLCRLVARLPPGARRLWNRAKRREFNVGVEAGWEPHSHEIHLEESTIEWVARLGGSIVITTYAPEVAPTKARPTARARGRKK